MPRSSTSVLYGRKAQGLEGVVDLVKKHRRGLFLSVFLATAATGVMYDVLTPISQYTSSILHNLFVRAFSPSIHSSSQPASLLPPEVTVYT